MCYQCAVEITWYQNLVCFEEYVSYVFCVGKRPAVLCSGLKTIFFVLFFSNPTLHIYFERGSYSWGGGFYFIFFLILKMIFLILICNEKYKIGLTVSLRENEIGEKKLKFLLKSHVFVLSLLESFIRSRITFS